MTNLVTNFSSLDWFTLDYDYFSCFVTIEVYILIGIVLLVIMFAFLQFRLCSYPTRLMNVSIKYEMCG